MLSTGVLLAISKCLHTCYHVASGVSQAHAEVQHMLRCVAGFQLQSERLSHCDERRPAAVDL